jgi:hypothetical protein
LDGSEPVLWRVSFPSREKGGIVLGMYVGIHPIFKRNDIETGNLSVVVKVDHLGVGQWNRVDK